MEEEDQADNIFIYVTFSKRVGMFFIFKENSRLKLRYKRVNTTNSSMQIIKKIV